MSIDRKNGSPSRQAQDRIGALVCQVQANADDRDAYAERVDELEQELAARGEPRG